MTRADELTSLFEKRFVSTQFYTVVLRFVAIASLSKIENGAPNP